MAENTSQIDATGADDNQTQQTPPTTPPVDFSKLQNEMASLRAQLASKDKKLKAANADIQSRMSEEEKLKHTQQAQLQELEQLRRDAAVMKYNNSFMAEGFTAERSASMANAIADGDMDTFFKNIKDYKADFEKRIKGEFVNSTPTPPSGTASTANLETELKAAFERGDNMSVIRIKREMEKQKRK